MTEMPQHQPEEALLVARVAAGDEQAYGQLVRHHAGQIRSVCRRYLGNEADADEVLQDVFLTLWRSASQYRPGRARLSTWLYQIAANRCRDRLRKGRSWSFFGMEFLQFHADDSPGADEQILQRQAADSVQADILSLPERQRMALLLACDGERSAGEIGAILGISKGAAEQLIVRARRSLRDRQRERDGDDHDYG